MALSKPVVPETVQDESVIAQHYLVCGTEDCEENCQFYCNDCHQPMCEQCQAKHQKSPDTKNHEMVPYQQRKIQLPVEKCEDHPTKDVDMICEDCQVPVCSKCVIQDHQKHALNDLEKIYSEKFTLCLEKVYKIHQYFIPTSQDKQRDIKENAKDVKKIMDDIRKSMKTETESLKCLLENVLSDNVEQVNKMEVSMMEELQSQDKTFEDYISYLKDHVKEVNGYMSSTKLKKNPFNFSLSNHFNIRPIPETTKPVPPIFTAGQYSKEDVTKLMGNVADTKPENSETNLMKTCFKIHRYACYLHAFLTLVAILSIFFDETP
nr:tripartite motif-containing protein 45 [Crassostrea gigas]